MLGEGSVSGALAAHEDLSLNLQHPCLGTAVGDWNLSARDTRQENPVFWKNTAFTCEIKQMAAIPSIGGLMTFSSWFWLAGSLANFVKISIWFWLADFLVDIFKVSFLFWISDSLVHLVTISVSFWLSDSWEGCAKFSVWFWLDVFLIGWVTFSVSLRLAGSLTFSATSSFGRGEVFAASCSTPAVSVESASPQTNNASYIMANETWTISTCTDHTEQWISQWTKCSPFFSYNDGTRPSLRDSGRANTPLKLTGSCGHYGQLELSPAWG